MEPDTPNIVEGAWIFYAKPIARISWSGKRAPQSQDTIFWHDDYYPRERPSKHQKAAGDTVQLLARQGFFASGVLLAGDDLTFADPIGHICRPVRILELYDPPLDLGELDSYIGGQFLPWNNPGPVHAMTEPVLDWFNLERQSRDYPPLPYPPGTESEALGRRSLLEDLTLFNQKSGLRPDAPTAEAIGWSGPFWRESDFPSQPKKAEDGEPSAESEPVGEQDPDPFVEEGAGEGRQDIDVQIPYVLDAPAESEDELERGPFALFLARRLHLIWCQINGHAPSPSGKPTRAPEADSDTFIVHVDSPWGGGKTTFANFVARVLDPRQEELTVRHFLKSSLAATTPPDRLGKVWLQDVFVPPFAVEAQEQWPGARRPWIIARYNAWRDQYVQPPWWQIFLTLHGKVTREVRRDAGAALGAAFALQPGEARVRERFEQGRDRQWRDIPGDLVDGLMLLPGRLWSGLQGLDRWAAAHLVRFGYQIWNSKLKAQVLLWLFIASLLVFLWQSGVIEFVLRNAGAGASSAADARKISDWIALAVAVLGLGGVSIATFFTVVTQSLSPDLDFTGEHKLIGVRDPIDRFRSAFDLILRATERPVLLIVDDLDRCDPGTVVEIMRGFQTIIRSPRLFVLLLGDRAWIEGAHDVHHKDLAGLDGGEGKLGSLYVRKVIQLSFRLPVMKDDSRRRFAHGILGLSEGATGIHVTPALRQIEEQARDIASGSGSIGSKEAALAQAIVDAKQLLPDDLSTDAKAEADAAIKEIANTQVVAAAGADTAQQREVFNAVRRLVDCLPNNPRQIKRIFMAFATYEQVGRRMFNYQLTPTGENGELLARRWRQLAMWVTLAVEWPETWRTVARNPELLDTAYAPAAERPDREKALFEGLGGKERSAVLATLRRLRTDPALAALLSGEARADVSPEAKLFAETAMEREAVYEFNRIIWEPGFQLQEERIG